MNQHDELRQQLWELAYGLLTPDEVAALHARIKSDPVVARLYAEVRLEADLVADAAKVSDPSLQFHPQGAPRVPKPAAAARPTPAAAPAKGSSLPPKSNRGVNWLAGMAGLALAALLCFVLFRPPPGGGQLAEAFIATTVEAPAQLQAGVSQRIAITTTDANETPRPAEVEVQLLNADGVEKLRETVSTDESGRASIVLPGTAIGEQSEWKFVAKPAGGDASKPSEVVPPVVFETHAAPEPVAAYVLFDKPTYEAGDTVHYAYRGVARFSKRPAATTHVGDGQAAVSEMTTEAAQPPVSDEPVVVGQFRLTEGVDPTHLLALRQGMERQLRLHGVQGDGDAINHFFLEQAIGSQQAQPAAPAPSALALKGELDGDRADAPRGGTDLLMRSDMRAKADAPRAQAAAEAGLLARREGQNQLSSGNIPTGDIAGGTATTSADAMKSTADPFAQSATSIVEAGKPIEVRLPDVPQVNRFLVTAQCADRVVAIEEYVRSQDKARGKDESEADAAAAADFDAASIVALDPPPEVDGEILVSVYADDQQPPHLLSEQRFFRQPQHRLELHVEGLQATYAPGQQVQLAVTVVDENSKPVDASLSVRVWNEALVAASPAPPTDLASQLLGSGRSSTPPTLAMNAYGAMGRKEALDDDAAKLNAYSDFASSEFKQDAPDASAALAFGHPMQLGDRLSLAITSSGETRQISNLAEAKSAYAAALSAAREEAAHRRATLGRLLLVGGLALLVLLAMQGLIKASAKTYVWLPSAIVATASLLIGIVWLNPSFQVGETLTTASRPDEASNRGATPQESDGHDATFERAALRAKTAEDATAPQKDERQEVESLESKQSEEESRDASMPAADGPVPPAAGGMAADALPADVAAKADLRRDDTAPLLAKKLQRETDAAPAAPSSAPMTVPAPATTQSFSAPPPKAGAGDAERVMPAEKELADSQPRPFGASQNGRLPAQDEVAERAASNSRTRRKAIDETAKPANRPGSADAPSGEPFAAKSALPADAAPAATPAPEPALPAPNAESLTESNAGSSRRMVRAKSTAEGDEPVDRVGRAKLAPAAMPEISQASDTVKQADAKGKASAPASLLFLPALATDSQGRATITFDLPAVDSEYRILIDAIGHGRIGSRQDVIRVQGTSDEAK